MLVNNELKFKDLDVTTIQGSEFKREQGISSRDIGQGNMTSVYVFDV